MLQDLRPITPPYCLREFTCCRYDPTALIQTLEDAQAAAETLLGMSSVGFGGTQARPAADNGVWENAVDHGRAGAQDEQRNVQGHRRIRDGRGNRQRTHHWLTGVFIQWPTAAWREDP